MSKMGPLTIEHIAQIQYAVSYLWEIQFTDQPHHASQLPPKFQDWLPCKTYQKNLATVTHKDFAFALGGYSIPYETSPFTIELSLYDQHDFALLKYFQQWYNLDTLGGKETALNYLGRAMKRITVRKWASYPGEGFKEVESEAATHLVCPAESLSDSGDSSGGIFEFTANLIIVGD